MSDSSNTSDADLESLVGRIADEVQERVRRGEPVDVEEYARRYPHAADVLRQVLPNVQLMRDEAPTPTGPELATEPALPEALGDYRIVRQIGRGGMGVVYEAVQESLGRHVALKVLPFQAGTDPLLLKRFSRETRAAARLHHSNIVPVFGVGVHEGVHYYAMQFIAGRPLDVVLAELQRLRRPPLAPAGSAANGDAPSVSGPSTVITPPAPGGANRAGGGSSTPSTDQGGGPAEDRPPALPAASSRPYFDGVARIGLQVAEALAYAHAHGVLHRDIKPSNLLLDTAGTVWVADFGLAKAEGMEDLTETGDVVGTLRYMAPERLQGQGDARADVYSLGVTLYELLTLRPAFDASNRLRLMQQLTREEPPRLRQLDSRIPRDLETVVLKASAKEPAARYPSAAALAEDLRLFLSERPITARRVTVAERLWRWCRRNPAVASLAALVLGVFLVGFVAVAFQWRRAERNFTTAEAQQQRAENYLLRAETRFAWGQEAIDEMLTQVAEGLADVPHLDPLRRQLLEKALQLQQKLLQEKSDDPAVRLEMVRAYRRLGDLYDLLEQPDQARPALRAALDLLETGGMDQDRELARVYHQLAKLHFQAGDQPQAQALCGSALAVYQRLLAGLGGDPATRLLANGSRQLLGDVYRQAGQFAETEKVYRQCLQELDEIPAGSDLAEPRFRRAVLLNNLGALYWHWHRLAEAEQAYVAALEQWQGLVRDFPRRRVHRQSLATGWYNLARLWAPPSMTRPLDALTAHRQALHMQAELAAEFPEVPRYRRELAGSYSAVARVYYQLHPYPMSVKRVLRHRGPLGALLAAAPAGPLALLPALAVPAEALPLEEARQAAVAGWKIDTELDRQFPDLPAYRSALAETCLSLGDILVAMDDFQEAERVLERGEELFADLAARFPTEGDYASGRGQILAVRAGGLRRQGRLAEAREVLERGLVYHRQALAHNEGHGIYQERVGTHFGIQASVLIALKDHVAAAEAMEQMVRHHPPNEIIYYRIAQMMAVCASLAEKDDSRSEAERRECAAKYASRTVELLAQSVQQTKGNPGLLAAFQNDRVFAPLRDRPDFQKVVNELKAKTKPPAP
jgi:serine/threonine-protein kinase